MSPPRAPVDDVDLMGAVGWVALAWGVSWLPIVRGSWIAAAVALGALLIVPGYTLVAALFPGSHVTTEDGSPTVAERLLFGVAASVALAMVLGVVLSVSGAGFSREAVLGGVTLLTLGFTAIAAVRRRGLESTVPVDRDALTAWSGWETPDQGLTVGLAVLAAVAILWLGALGAGVGGESLVETYLLTESDDGYVAVGYPTTFEAGEARPIQVGVENHRDEPVSYTVIVVQQRVAPDDPTVVREQSELDRFGLTVPPGTERTREHALAPETTGDIRVRYLFYERNPPPTVGEATATQQLQLWVTVESPSMEGEEGA